MLSKLKHGGNLSVSNHQFGQDVVISFGFLTDNSHNYTHFKNHSTNPILKVPEFNLNKTGTLNSCRVINIDRFCNRVNHTDWRIYPPEDFY